MLSLKVVCMCMCVLHIEGLLIGLFQDKFHKYVTFMFPNILVSSQVTRKR